MDAWVLKENNINAKTAIIIILNISKSSLSTKMFLSEKIIANEKIDKIKKTKGVKIFAIIGDILLTKSLLLKIK